MLSAITICRFYATCQYCNGIDQWITTSIHIRRPRTTDSRARVPPGTKDRRGPLLYFATAGIIAVVIAIPLLVPRSMAVKDDPNPLGYLLILISFPIGGLVYRIRSREWPIDRTVRSRQITACYATLLLPIAAALLTGMRGQGLHITV